MYARNRLILSGTLSGSDLRYKLIILMYTCNFLKLINNSSKLNKENHKHVYMYLDFFARLMMKNFKTNHYRSGKIPQTFLNPESSMNGFL